MPQAVAAATTTTSGLRAPGGSQAQRPDDGQPAAPGGELFIISPSIVIEAPSGGPQTNQSQGSQAQGQPQQAPWMLVAAQTTQGMRQRMSLASDQLGISLRQLYASASSITDVPPSYHNIPGVVPYYHGRSSGPPPSYEDVINPFVPPPSYQSLFGQMREARKTSRGLMDLVRRLLIILISTLGCTILIAFMLLIPFTMIIVGAVYIDECRIEHIPALLLVGGLVWVSKNLIHCYVQCSRPASGADLPAARTDGASPLQRREEIPAPSGLPEEPPAREGGQRHWSAICESLLNCLLFCWFIVGCVIVFRNYEPDFDNPSSARYCHRTVYMYAFGLISSAIGMFSLFVGCICCLMVSSAIAGRQEEADLA